MAGVAEVLAFERNAAGDVVRYDKGGDDVGTAEHFSAPGDDAVPLRGDTVVLVDGDGEGGEYAAGFDDATEKTATEGEKRIYARNAAGAVVAEIWLRSTGAIEITVAPGVQFKINGGTQSAVLGENLFAYLDQIIAAVSTGLSGVPVAGAGLAAAFNVSVTAALPAKQLAVSQIVKLD